MVKKKKLLVNAEQVTTMMNAIDLLEGGMSNDQFISAARQHYTTVKQKGLLNMLLALVRSEEPEEAIDGASGKKL